MQSGVLIRALLLCLAASLVGSCSLRSMAVGAIGDMLASDQSVFTDDDDIELIGDALPFSLKLIESLIAEDPEHQNLLLTAARGYTLYAYAYVDFPAEQAAPDDVEEARVLRARARRLYMRAFGYAMRGVEVDYPGFGAQLATAPERAANRLGKKENDLPLLYWSAASLGLAISVSKGDPAMLARLGEVEALLNQALAVQEDYDSGALHEFAVTWTGAAPGNHDPERARRHYQRALELSGGQRAGLYVTYAMAVSVPEQNRAQFTDLLNKALAVDPDATPNERLNNLLAQRRAAWLLGRVDELFFE